MEVGFSDIGILQRTCKKSVCTDWTQTKEMICKIGRFKILTMWTRNVL